MNSSNYSIKISKSSLTILLWICFSALLVIFDFKTFLNFNSSDEKLFLTFSEIDSSLQFIRYIIWGGYISSLSAIHPLFPILLNLLIFGGVLSLFVKKFDVQNTYLVLFLLIPSLIFFSQTYLRDFSLLIINLFLFIAIAKKNSSKSIFAVLVIATLIFALRPLFGIIVYFSLLSSILIRKVKFSLSYVFLGQIIILLILFSVPNLKDMFMTEYLKLNGEDVFSLLRIDLFNLKDSQLAVGILFNWLLYYFGVNIGMGNFWLLFPFFLESAIYLILLKSFIFFNKMRFKEDFLYRFSFWLIVFSIVSSILEADWASVYRHKLFFIPPLIYMTTKKAKY
tara:strand:- start:1780 stop:2793 length:1014 start_codon:yes stop_codon:yes gene_type:complete